MALEMRTQCERCDTALSAESTDAMICSYECTFCQDCGDAMAAICPNCQGQLLPRPTKLKKN